MTDRDKQSNAPDREAALLLQPNIKPLMIRLARYTPLNDADERALVTSLSTLRHYPAHADLIRQGEATDGLQIILEGFACRYKTLSEGKLQIVAYLIPGDVCDVRNWLLRRMDHSIGTLTPVVVSVISQGAVEEMMRAHPALARAFWCSTLVEESITREWVVNVGHRSAFARLAHLFCELFARLQAVGLTSGTRCELPLSQADLAHALALSPVHVNRTLMQLRRAGLISFRGHELVIHDRAALEEASDFNADYLHLARAPGPVGEKCGYFPTGRTGTVGNAG